MVPQNFIKDQLNIRNKKFIKKDGCIWISKHWK